MSQELNDKLNSLVSVMDEVFFEEDADVDTLTPELIARYCELKSALARESVTKVREYLRNCAN